MINYFNYITLSYKQLIEGQRYQIQVLLQDNTPKKRIAELVGTHISTIYREINRNKGKRKYTAKTAQELCDLRKERFGRNRKFNCSMKKVITDKIIQEQWSPQQIEGRCKRDNIPMVSHERIYQFIRENKSRGGVLWKHTRHKLKNRKRPVTGNQVSIKNRVSISERPSIVESKNRIGDWEIDTIIGKNQKGAIVTIVERKTGFLLMRKLKHGKQAMELSKTVVRMLIAYKDVIKTITSDNGKEFAEHGYISKRLDADFYFADPYCSWQRGLNENTNGLIRQYIPKGTCFSEYSDDYISLVQNKINRRPRKNINFRTPSEKFYASLE